MAFKMKGFTPYTKPSVKEKIKNWWDNIDTSTYGTTGPRDYVKKIFKKGRWKK